MTKPVLSDPITLRLPLDILEDIEKIAETADRSRSWVIVRALKYYLMAEGSEVLSIRRGLEDVAAGRTVDADEFLAELDRLNREDAA
ncbi:ribbon-helix-helix protein, CopG family [Rhizobium sp. LC145]|uniref:CopG family ribbon-helix-helix protein n=1 Tax=Rhizobium sp. LC145 TaxID=1120688 RepID=UPI00062A319E|nr:ribbon-helix-helix protein, CopG family [Rhizobium sp. LC145]KKX28062.1 CopG family transcriptional regulator [Rhizobium sp. LC145]TKT43059.1 ribbon-helix-helix protein, CopG family [Rhizobiaceae bacterium LC148]